MSRALNIIVEGETEKDFVRDSIIPYFARHEIHNIRAITIETSPGFKGGDIRYARYRPNVIKLLYGREDLLVTSLIDYYRLRPDFPKFEEAHGKSNVHQKIDFLEKACYEDISDKRFIPYIQLHEFEGLLFSDSKGFENFRSLIPPQNMRELLQIMEEFPNPELINDRPQYAPSKRLLRLIPEYSKPLYGNFIALENGFDILLQKCPRFKNWIETLISRMRA